MDEFEDTNIVQARTSPYAMPCHAPQGLRTVGATHNVADSHRRVQADDGKLAAGSGAYIVREEPTDPILRTRRSTVGMALGHCGMALGHCGMALGHCGMALGRRTRSCGRGGPPPWAAADQTASRRQAFAKAQPVIMKLPSVMIKMQPVIIKRCEHSTARPTALRVRAVPPSTLRVPLSTPPERCAAMACGSVQPLCIDRLQRVVRTYVEL
jgi:hypothetical protein